MGAHVTGLSSAATGSYVRELGADEVLDYRAADFKELTGQFDLVLDIGGRTPVRRLRRVLTRKGRLVIVGGEGGRWTGVGRQAWASLVSLFVPQRMGTFVAKENRALLEDLNAYVAAGQLRPRVWRDFPLLEAADAMRALDIPHPPGRIVLTT